MIELPETPLQRVGARELFLKREDLLPYGGGNKVPRFLHALAQRNGERHVAALSDYGSHSFTVLTAMARDPALAIDELELWELPIPPDPYHDALAGRYAEAPNVTIRRGSTVGLVLRWVARGRRAGVCRLGIGGTVKDAGQTYQPAVEACGRQLLEAGVGGPAVHVLPLASGDTAVAVLSALRACGRDQDQVAGVITGPWIGHARLSLKKPEGFHLVKPRARSWDDYVAGARTCHGETGVWLDPSHTLPAWDSLDRLPAPLRDLPTVMWVTCPELVTPPFPA